MVVGPAVDVVAVVVVASSVDRGWPVVEDSPE